MARTAPLLAIVVPTRNRHQYVHAAIRSLVCITSRDIEIVIEDNSDSSQLENWIHESPPDARLIYNYSDSRTSQRGNYERSMRGVTADYVAFIGDDDGVNPEIVAVARWAKARGYDAVVPLNRAHFVWPDLHMKTMGAMAAGELRIGPITGNAWEPDPEVELRKCVLGAGQAFHDLPRAYYGIVRRETLEQVRAKTGAFFPGVSPDLATAVALANVTRKVCVVDYPIFLPGSSLRSNAGVGGLNKHVGKLAGQSHLGPDCERNWSAIVPPFFSIQTIWAEAAVEALIAMGREDLIRLFNVPKLYAELAMFHPDFLGLTFTSFWSALHRTQRPVVKGVFAWLGCYSKLGLLRAQCLLRRLKRRAPYEETYSRKGIVDIQQAVKELQEHLSSKGWLFGPQGVAGPRPSEQQTARILGNIT
jgi:hypothetical protein